MNRDEADPCPSPHCLRPGSKGTTRCRTTCRPRPQRDRRVVTRKQKITTWCASCSRHDHFEAVVCRKSVVVIVVVEGKMVVVVVVVSARRRVRGSGGGGIGVWGIIEQVSNSPNRARDGALLMEHRIVRFGNKWNGRTAMSGYPSKSLVVGSASDL